MILEYTLIVIFYAGTLSSSSASSMIAIPGFTTLEGPTGCQTAGREALHALEPTLGTYKVKYHCVRVK